jgi:hypothetical protein
MRVQILSCASVTLCHRDWRHIAGRCRLGVNTKNDSRFCSWLFDFLSVGGFGDTACQVELFGAGILGTNFVTYSVGGNKPLDRAIDEACETLKQVIIKSGPI